MRALWERPGEKTWALRGIHRLLRLPEVQVHAADHPGHQMPEVQRRGIRPPRQRREKRPWAPAGFLRLLALPGLQLYDGSQADCRTLPEVRRAVHRREANQNRNGALLLEGRL